MEKDELTARLADLAQGKDTPESWQQWWDEHKEQTASLLSPGEFLQLRPRQHGFKWVPLLAGQKVAVAILQSAGISVEASPVYHERYLEELDNFSREQKRLQKEKQSTFKTNFPQLCTRYPRFCRALARVLEVTDEIRMPAAPELITEQEHLLEFTFPDAVREFFTLTAGIRLSSGITVDLSSTFILEMDAHRYCVLGEYFKEADGDLLLLTAGEQTILYYAHERNQVTKLCNDMNELLELKLSRYLNSQ